MCRWEGGGAAAAAERESPPPPRRRRSCRQRRPRLTGRGPSVSAFFVWSGALGCVHVCACTMYLGAAMKSAGSLGGRGAEGRGEVKFLVCKTLVGVRMCCARPGCMWGVKGGIRLESVDWRRCCTQNKMKARGAAAQGRACTHTAAAAAERARFCCCRGAGDDCWWARVPAALRRGGVQHKCGAFVFFVPAEGGKSEWGQQHVRDPERSDLKKGPIEAQARGGPPVIRSGEGRGRQMQSERWRRRAPGRKGADKPAGAARRALRCCCAGGLAAASGSPAD